MVTRTYPEPGEVWEHPDSRNQYMVHSRTDDGWTRYYSHHASVKVHDCFPLYTQPTDRFASIYRKRETYV